MAELLPGLTKKRGFNISILQTCPVTLSKLFYLSQIVSRPEVLPHSGKVPLLPREFVSLSSFASAR